MQTIIKNKLLSSIILLALGILLIVAPNDVPQLFVRIIGAVLLCGAVVRLIAHFTAEKDDRVPISLMIAAVAAAFGIFLLAAPGVVVKVINIVFGALLILNALLDLVIALRLPVGKTIDVILALIGLAIGIVIVINPSAFAAFITILIGGALIYAAVVGIVTVLLGRKTAKSNLLKK